MSLSVAQWIPVDIVTVLSIQPKRSKIWKQQQMVQKFPGKFSSNSRNCWISEMWTFQPKIPEILREKFNWKKTSGKIFLQIWVYLPRLSSFWKFWKMLFHSLMKVDEKSDWTFWLNGKHPVLTGWNIIVKDLQVFSLSRDLPGDHLSCK